MRVCAPLLLAVSMLWAASMEAAAQERTFRQTSSPPLDASAGRGQPLQREWDADPQAAAKRFADETLRRLLPIQQLMREDPRLRSAGAVLGAGLIALTATRGSRSLARVGTGVLRFGLDAPLTQLRNRSGLVVEPSIGHRTVAITFKRTFVN